MKGDREICLKAGMDDYLGKIRPRELASVLERWGKPWPEATASLLALAERSAALAERSAAVVLPLVNEEAVLGAS
jgi:CheY-like chemotaxis protein